VPHSPALSAVGALISASLATWACAHAGADCLIRFAEACLRVAGSSPGAPEAKALCASALLDAGIAVAIIGGAGFVGGAITHALQTRFLWASPLRGRGPSVSPGRGADLGRRLGVTALALMMLAAAVARVLHVLAQAGPDASATCRAAALAAAAVLTPGMAGVGLLDLAWRRMDFTKAAWMTETEMRDEIRDTESNANRRATVRKAVRDE